MRTLNRKIVMAVVLGVCLGATVPCSAALNVESLPAEDVARVKKILAELEPMIRAREAEETLAKLTFDELYHPLTGAEHFFLEEFKALGGAELGVSIPFRGIATGEEELIVIKDQNIKVDGLAYTIPPQYLPPEPYQRYLEMMEAMENDLGRRLYVESGYRSSAYQLYLFVFYLKNHKYSIADTVKWVALPGYSEHGAPAFQAIDFISADGISGEEHPEDFENLDEYHWLLDNAERFGFTLSYPRGEEGITFEPWHWRYEHAVYEQANSS